MKSLLLVLLLCPLTTFAKEKFDSLNKEASETEGTHCEDPLCYPSTSSVGLLDKTTALESLLNPPTNTDKDASTGEQ